MNKIKVINIKNETDYHYIGRGTPLGNPFKINEWGSRREVIMLYKSWLNNEIEYGNLEVCKELNVILDKCKKRGYINLGCHCKPKDCHGDVIKELLDALIADESN